MNQIFLIFFPLTYEHLLIYIYISKPTWMIKFELIKSLKPSQLFVYPSWFYFGYLVNSQCDHKQVFWPF